MVDYICRRGKLRTRRKSFKCKKTVWNAPSEWSIFENTHEPIIDQETFDIVQRIRDGRRRLTPIGEMPILSGMWNFIGVVDIPQQEQKETA